MHQGFRQCRGATIGNQISPMLAGLIVSMEEEIYVRQLQSFLHPSKTSLSALGMLTIVFWLFHIKCLKIVGFNTFRIATSINIVLNWSMLPAKMPLKSSEGLIFNWIIIVFNICFDLIFGRSVSQIVQDPKDIALQLFIVPEPTSNDTFGSLHIREAQLERLR